MGGAGAYTFLVMGAEDPRSVASARPGAAGPHEQILTATAAQVVRGEDDSLLGVFARPSDAVRAAVETVRQLGSDVRIGLHSGEAETRGGRFFGVAVGRAARLRDAAHGGQILCSAAVHLLVVDTIRDGTTFVDLGPHRLPDLGRPERVFQVAADGLEADFPAIASLDGRPNNLPQQPPFVGRSVELAAAVSLLRRDDARLVTVTGPRGIGKTRLALQAAADALHRFEDGVWIVEGVERCPVGDRPVLLVLEDADGADVDALNALFAARPRVRVIATARRRLGSRWEHEVRLGPMPDDDARELYRERARCGSDVSSLDGLPLAIVRTAAGEDDPFGPDVRAAASDALAACMRHERDVVASLAAFAGWFDVDAACDVASCEASTVAELVDAGLLYERDGRFRVPPVVRDAGVAPDADALARHADLHARRRWTAAELEDVRAAVARASASGRIAILAACDGALPSDAHGWLTDALASDGLGPDDRVRALLLRAATGDAAGAERDAREAHRLADALGDAVAARAALSELAGALETLGRTDEAREARAAAGELAR